jgi:hypothetical protein
MIAAAVLTVATPTLAAWTNPFPINNVNGDASSPSIGIDAAGNAVIAYREAGGGLLLNTRAANGTIGTRVPINDVPAGPPFLATNAAGVSAIVWQESDGVNSVMHLRLRRANGAFTTNRTISQSGVTVFSPAVGIDAAGNAYAAWGANVGGVNRIFMRVMNGSTGALSSVISVSPSTGNNQDPHIAVEPSGRALVVYRNFGSGGQQIFGRFRSAAGALSGIKTLSDFGVTGPPSVALDASGRGLVAWTLVISGQARAQARTFASNGVLGAITTLSTGGSAADSVEAVMSGTGNVGVVAWRRPVGADLLLQARRIVGGAWQAVENVSPAGMNVLELRVGMSGDGSRTIFLFSTSEEGGLAGRIRARTRSPSGSYGLVEIVSSENGLFAQNPRLSVNASGQAAAAWRQQQDNERGDLIWVGSNFL